MLSVAIEYSITPERLRALAAEALLNKSALKDEWTVAAALYERYLEELAQERKRKLKENWVPF